MRIENHRLVGEGVRHIESPNRGGTYAESELDTIVIHFTAGSSVEGAIETLCSSERKVSAHLVIGRDGAVAQLLPFDVIGWHAGVSKWGEREGFNKYSIGFEIDNAGQLREEDGKYISWFGQEYPEEEVVSGVHRNQTQLTYWHSYTATQLQTVEALCLLLIEEYGIKHILGHEEIAPDRKVDPGPAFPLDAWRARLLPGPLALARRGKVQATRLNMRAAPNGQAEKVAGYLNQGTEVDILEKRKGWYRVAVELEGWVAARYVEEV
jgi:N-acetylmuramoyl-L-alanine amidase